MLLATLSAGAFLLSASNQVPTRWPVAGYIYRVPDIPNPNWLSGHRGIDLVPWDGHNVFSPVDGEVSWTGEINFQTGLTIVDNAGRKHTLMQIETELVAGDLVFRGSVLGRVVPSNHCAGELCVHWGVRENGRYIDPRWLTEPLIFELP